MRMRIFTLTLFFAAISFMAAAQSNTAAIKTKVTDDKSAGIDGATVSLLNAADSSLVKVNITEHDGSVSFDQVKNGSYLLSTSVVGFKKQVTKPVNIDQDNQKVVIPDIRLEANASQLKEVSVQAKRPLRFTIKRSKCPG